MILIKGKKHTNLRKKFSTALFLVFHISNACDFSFFFAHRCLLATTRECPFHTRIAIKQY